MKKKLLVMGLAAVFAMTGMVSGQNLLVNGDFESSVALLDTNGVPNGLYASASWEHWGWEAGFSEITVKPLANGGNESVLLNVGNGWQGGGGGAFQIVTATEEQWYHLSVDSGADAWWQPVGEMALIWLDSTNGIISSVSQYTVDPAVHGDPNDTLHPMQNYSLYAQAPIGAESVKVEFASRTPYWVGGAVTFDNASLQVVPEPATLGLLGLSGLALWIVRRRI